MLACVERLQCQVEMEPGRTAMTTASMLGSSMAAE